MLCGWVCTHILPQTLRLEHARFRMHADNGSTTGAPSHANVAARFACNGSVGGRTMSAEAKLASMDLVLPEIPRPLANYVPFKISGNTLYLSGQGPRRNDGTLFTGKVGKDVTAEQAYEHAKLVGLGLLAAAKAAAGSLDKIEVLKVLGMVNAVPDFADHPKVINGCSDLFVAVLGDRGRHARSAVGMGSLPGNISVEIEAVLRIHD
jgi:enamine deaminase RidA (YjgF/YER057c/UK114 family)